MIRARCLYLICLVGLVGCTVFEAKEASYLRSAQDRATQDEVEQQLGPPARIQSAENGDVVWVYDIRYEQPGNYLVPTGTWCDEYVLTFDSQAILRQWTHKAQFHGGELMPTYCVRDGFKPAS
jgi:hypothetical protein